MTANALMWRSLGVWAVALLTVAPATAQDANTPLRVATRAVPPFAMQDEQGAWSGIAIELWRDAAAELGLSTEFESAEIADMLVGVADGRYDAAVAALTMTAEREAQLDFTHPYFVGGLGIAVRPAEGSAWQTLLGKLLSIEFFSAIASLTVLLLLVGLVVWLLERKRNPEQFGGNAAQGLGSGFWWSAVTMTTVGYGDKAPATVGGRLVALVWMFASIILISGMTAAIASALTVSQLATPIDGPEDLPGIDVATVAGSTSEGYLRERLITASVTTETPRAALEALAAGRVDAVVYDAAILRYLTRRGFDTPLKVLPREFEPQNYAIALPPKSPLREQLNRIILRRTSEREWRELTQRYQGGGE